MNELSTLIIHNNSFTYKSYNGWIPETIFRIKNCESLESIEIGIESFLHFAGEFKLENLPSLQSIKIGELESSQYSQGNFQYSSLDIRGIELY